MKGESVQAMSADNGGPLEERMIHVPAEPSSLAIRSEGSFGVRVVVIRGRRVCWVRPTKDGRFTARSTCVPLQSADSEQGAVICALRAKESQLRRAHIQALADLRSAEAAYPFWSEEDGQ